MAREENVTSQAKRVKDRRVQKTETLLRDALTSLIREKAYDSIVVKEILERANVGRSTFYTHFRDKDDLLASSIYEMLRPARLMQPPSSAKPYEKIIRFSLPIFEELQQHRHERQRAGNAMMDDRSRAILHERLQNVLVELIGDDVDQWLQGRREGAGRMPSDVLVNYVASTFVLVLDWWVETDSLLAPKEVNDLFRALVLPTLVTTLRE
jgi:AcrR family transcriptional regulator